MDNVNITSTKLVDTDSNGQSHGLLNEGWEWTKANAGNVALGVAGAAAFTVGLSALGGALARRAEGSLANAAESNLARVGSTTLGGDFQFAMGTGFDADLARGVHLPEFKIVKIEPQAPTAADTENMLDISHVIEKEVPVLKLPDDYDPAVAWQERTAALQASLTGRQNLPDISWGKPEMPKGWAQGILTPSD